MAPDREDIWSFSPCVDLSIYRWIRRNLPKPHPFEWQTMFFVTIVALRFVQTELHAFRAIPPSVWRVPTWWVEVLIYATSVDVIGTELKIWNSVRIQIKLEEQERLLLHSRMEALQNQINPHFLFNTLNSVSSLVRFDPDTARELIIKLANILRRLLNSSDAFVPLREELEFIDNYLDIEVVRFGRDKLRVVKELEPASLDIMVPSMLLQPLVENSIKHGLSSKIDGGSIYLRSRLADSHLIIEVEDDGVGMGSANLLERPTGLGGTGIGMANVAERLKVLYGDTARMTIDSREGKGTLVRLRLPVLQGRRDSGDALRRAFQHPPIKLLVLRNDPAGAEARLRHRPAGFPISCRRSSSLEQFDGVAGHGFHVAHVRQVAALAVLDHFRHAAHAGGDGHHFAGHAFERGQPERLQFAGQKQDVGQGQLLLHLLLLAQENHVVVNALLHRQPFRARAVGPVADHQQFGRNLLAYPIEDLDRVGHPFHRAEIGQMHQHALAVRRVFRPLSERTSGSRQYTSQLTKL